MSITQSKNGIWQIYFRTPSGKRVRFSSKTTDKQAAQELHDKCKYEAWRQEQLDEKPKKYWDEACVRWIEENQDKRTLDSDITKIRLLPELRGVLLEDLTRDFIHKVVNKKTCSNSTKNRYFALIRSILRKCADEWEWIEKAPKINFHKEPKRRIRWLYPEEALRLVNALENLPHIQHMVIFSLATGLRQSNVLNLMWEQIDLNRRVAWVYPDQAKAGRAIGVALNDTAMKVLEARLTFPRGRYVFTNPKGHAIKAISSKTWSNALKKAGIENFRWHDLRHTWASWLVQAGTPLSVLQEMGGWESISMVQRYAHLAPEHLSRHAAVLDMNFIQSNHSIQKLSKFDFSVEKIMMDKYNQHDLTC